MATGLKGMQEAVDGWVTKEANGYWEPGSIMLRMMEETGELAREINQRFGDKPRKPTEGTREIGDEVGDILFTIACLANSLNIDLESSFRRTMDKYGTRDRYLHKK
jgi:NTP pyrophosphatase (non-canonical NTP hydrolase)